MASPTYFVFDGDGGANAPRKPSSADVGGYAKLDDADYPPDPTTMLAAADWNQIARLIEGMGRLIGCATITVAAGVSAVITGAVGLGTGITTATFTLVRNGAGDYSITWPASKFPVTNIKATGLTIWEDLLVTTAVALPITNGIRVKTKVSGTLTDAGFSVTINSQ